jgi:hypothetical protein
MEKTKELKKEKKKKKRGRKSYRQLKWAEAAVEKRERKISVESSSGAEGGELERRHGQRRRSAGERRE